MVQRPPTPVRNIVVVRLETETVVQRKKGYTQVLRGFRERNIPVVSDLNPGWD